jgi:glyoxylase-like metal-dependent hydrolase (beta-lactamase superfamily II)
MIALGSAVAALAAYAPAIRSMSTQPAAQGTRLYVLDCGTLIYNNPETYNLTRQEVRNTNMSVVCYLVAHQRGTLLFDTGLPDNVAGRAFNETPLNSRQSNPPSTTYFMQVTKTLKSQLTAIGFTPEKINYLAVSHYHTDHVGNANDYAASVWLVQQGDFDAMFGPDVAPESVDENARSLRTSRKQLLKGDHDVFGDGTVVLKSTPGHTPGHQSLYVRLVRAGGIVLSGDLYHYPEERTLNRMPEREKSTQTPASRAALEAFMMKMKAALWIGHDISLYSTQKKSPDYYD